MPHKKHPGSFLPLPLSVLSVTLLMQLHRMLRFFFMQYFGLWVIATRSIRRITPMTMASGPKFLSEKTRMKYDST